MPALDNLLAVFVGNRAVVFAQLLADGVHLTAQEVLALLLLRAVFDVVVDALSHLQLREPLPLELERQLEPLDDVERFEELQLLVEVQVRRIAGRVGQRAGVGDRPHERADPSIVAAQLENLVDDRAVFAFQLAREARRRRLRPDGLRSRPAARRPGRPPRRRGSRDGAPISDTASPRPASRTRSDTSATTPTLRVGVVAPRHQQHPVVAADVDRQRHRHARKHHRVIQGNDSQPVHSSTFQSARLRADGRVR